MQVLRKIVGRNHISRVLPYKIKSCYLSTVAPSNTVAKATATPIVEQGDQEGMVDSGPGSIKAMGVDTQFNRKKHSFILDFPWGLNDVIEKYESSSSNSSFWSKFVKNQEFIDDFNILFREFHQGCAIPDRNGLKIILEPRLENRVWDSICDIHYNGLDVEMANLTVNQPKWEVLKVEVYKGLNVDRSKNHNKENYEMIQCSSWLGAPYTKCLPKEDRSSMLDVLDTTQKPYLLAVTMLVESPMKLFVFNQNRSAILFGDKETTNSRNVLRFEINLRLGEFFHLLPVINKPEKTRRWKITDINGVMDENPYFY